MSRSARELYDRALELLTVLGAGQTASADDWEAMRRACRPLLAELRSIDALNLWLTPNDEEAQDISEAVFDPLAALLANEAAPAFGIPRVDGAGRAEMLRRLRAVTRNPHQGYPQDVSFF